jgi:hypothetical protein
LNKKSDQIIEIIKDLEKASRAVREEALRMSWYMRGGLTYEDAMYLSQTDRETIGQIIKDNMQTTKESGLPFF